VSVCIKTETLRARPRPHKESNGERAVVSTRRLHAAQVPPEHPEEKEPDTKKAKGDDAALA